VCNIFGRRTHITGINDKNFNIRNFQERASINAPIQGSASEIMKMAMIRISKKLEELKESNCTILLQIHDELIFEVHQDDLKKYSLIIQTEMSSVKN
jgi:DNA polymerase I - 3''-5'' exonuclease and polymerase domains